MKNNIAITSFEIGREVLYCKQQSLKKRHEKLLDQRKMVSSVKVQVLIVILISSYHRYESINFIESQIIALAFSIGENRQLRDKIYEQNSSINQLALIAIRDYC